MFDLSRRKSRNAAVRKQGCATILGKANKTFTTANMKKSIITEHHHGPEQGYSVSFADQCPFKTSCEYRDHEKVVYKIACNSDSHVY